MHKQIFMILISYFILLFNIHYYQGKDNKPHYESYLKTTEFKNNLRRLSKYTGKKVVGNIITKSGMVEEVKIIYKENGEEKRKVYDGISKLIHTKMTTKTDKYSF